MVWFELEVICGIIPNWIILMEFLGPLGLPHLLHCLEAGLKICSILGLLWLVHNVLALLTEFK
jgi:hypothetical protein